MVTHGRLRPAIVISAFLCAAACARGQGAPDARPAVEIGFDNLGEAWSVLAESSFARAPAASGWLDRADVKRHKARLDAAIAEAEAHLGMPLRAPLAEILRGTGVLILADENGAPAFAVELRPAGPVDFRAIVDRAIERDPEVVRLRGPRAGGGDFERIRVKGAELLVRIEANRLRAGSSRALLAAASAAPAVAEGACLRVRVHPDAARTLSDRGSAPPIPIERVECALKATRAGIELAGAVRCNDGELLAPFTGVAPSQAMLEKLLPRDVMAFAAFRADLKALWALGERFGPPEGRELLRRRMDGIAYAALGGRAVPDVLDGLGPDVLLAVAGRGEGGEPAAFALLASIRTAYARDALLALGRAFYGAAALQKREARMEEAEGRAFFSCDMGEHRVTIGVREDLLCVSTSEALARTVCAADAARAGAREAADRPACAAAVDTAALGSWLRRNKAMLSERPAWRHGFRRPDEIEAAAAACEALAGARAVLAVEGATVTFTLGLDFAAP